MADVGSIRFAIMILITARPALSRLLQPGAHAVLRDEGRIPAAPGAAGARPTLSNEINELTLTKP
jgi:hypothetical protein